MKEAKSEAPQPGTRARFNTQMASFREELEARREARATKPDNIAVLKFAVVLVIGIFGYTYYVFVVRCCIPMVRLERDRLGGRVMGIVFLAVFHVLWVMFVWSYLMAITTSPGFAADFVPPGRRPPSARAVSRTSFGPSRGEYPEDIPEEYEGGTVPGPRFETMPERPMTGDKDRPSRDQEVDSLTPLRTRPRANTGGNRTPGAASLDSSTMAGTARRTSQDTGSRQHTGSSREQSSSPQGPSGEGGFPEASGPSRPMVSISEPVAAMHRWSGALTEDWSAPQTPASEVTMGGGTLPPGARKPSFGMKRSGTPGNALEYSHPPSPARLSTTSRKGHYSSSPTSPQVPRGNARISTSSSAGNSYRHFPPPPSSYVQEQPKALVQRVPSTWPILKDESRWCARCEIVKPYRAHHCRHCGRCVLKMDHHCPWVGTCVGARNYKYFINFLQWSMLFCCFVFLALTLAEFRPGAPFRRNPDPQKMVVLGLAGIFMVFTFGLLTTHVWLIWHNLSTIEDMTVRTMIARERGRMEDVLGRGRWSVKRRMRKEWDREWGHPFAEGNLWWLGSGRANWEQAMGQSLWGWFLPLPGRPTHDDGLSYIPNPRFSSEGIQRRRDEWPEQFQ